MAARPFRNRILVQFITASSFVATSLSGIAVFIAPQRNVASWTDWTFLALSKSQWVTLHILTGLLFMISCIAHVWYNKTSLIQYLRGIPGRVTAGWRELIIALLVTASFCIGAATKSPPFDTILRINAWLKESWIEAPADGPPFSDAELISLKDFCAKMSIESGAALRELRQAGLTADDETKTVAQIARANRISPATVYLIIRKLERPDVSRPASLVPKTAQVAR